jgi:hexokinase
MSLQVDNLFISHFHAPEAGYRYLEEDDWLSDGQISASSVIHKSKETKIQRATVSPKVSFHAILDTIYLSHVALQDMEQLRETSTTISTSAEVARYIQDIVVFLRLSRAVSGGVSAKANIEFSRFAQ